MLAVHGFVLIFPAVMSTRSNKKTSTGVRYTAEQKKKIVEFVANHNKANGRGGQSAASKKFKVTPLTIAAWIKAAGVAPKGKAKKVAKPAKSSKSAKSSNTKKGVRYSAEQKQKVVDFVSAYNAKHGRGGQSQAAKKFALSVLTVASWLRSPKLTVSTKASKAGSVPAGINPKVASLIEVSDQLRKAEAEVDRLRARYDELRSSIQSICRASLSGNLPDFSPPAPQIAS